MSKPPFQSHMTSQHKSQSKKTTQWNPHSLHFFQKSSASHENMPVVGARGGALFVGVSTKSSVDPSWSLVESGGSQALAGLSCGQSEAFQCRSLLPLRTGSCLVATGSVHFIFRFCDCLWVSAICYAQDGLFMKAKQQAFSQPLVLWHEHLKEMDYAFTARVLVLENNDLPHPTCLLPWDQESLHGHGWLNSLLQAL